MKKKLVLRKAHRYIGLIISVQLLLWTLGGIYFSWVDIDEIHGDHLKKTLISKNKPQVSAANILASLADLKEINSLNIKYLAEKPVYQLNYISKQGANIKALVDAETGEEISQITEELAKQIAISNASFNADIQSIQLLKETDSHHEYRAKNLPAWAVTFDYESSPTFYINAKTGKLESVRHDSWRIFDLLWMLHTMDYQGRDDFGNWLLKLFSIIALLTSISGITLFFISIKRRRKPKS